MQNLVINGTYANGQVQLATLPPGITEAPVQVVFLGDDAGKAARIAAGERLLQIFKRGYDLGGPPYPRREELYDRKICRGS